MRRAAIVLVAALTAACGSSSAASSSSSTSSPAPTTASLSTGPAVPPVQGIEAEAVRLRTDEALGGQVQTRVTNTGDAPFTVTSVALDSPGFAPLPPRAETATYQPKQVIDLPTPFGEAICGTAAQPAAARLTVVRPDGTTEDVRVPLSADVLDLIHEQTCAAEAVLAVADIEVEGLHDDGDGSTGTLTLTRRSGSQEVTVTRLGRSVVLAPTVADLPLRLAGGAPSAASAISFTPASCDAHVLAETKKPYVFVLGVRVGGGDEVSLDLPLDQGDKDALAAMVQRVCG
jgi:hypothetical protein